MPLNRTPLTGNQIVAMANVSLQRNYTLTGDDSNDPTAQTVYSIVNEINVLGLPSLTYWVRLNSAVGGIVFTPMFSVQNTTVGGVTVPNWLPFTNGAVLVPGNVFTFFVRSAVANAAVEFTIGPTNPATTINVDVVITAGG
jgi:hypothetical protein